MSPVRQRKKGQNRSQLLVVKQSPIAKFNLWSDLTEIVS